MGDPLAFSVRPVPEDAVPSAGSSPRQPSASTMWMKCPEVGLVSGRLLKSVPYNNCTSSHRADDQFEDYIVRLSHLKLKTGSIVNNSYSGRGDKDIMTSRFEQ